MTGPSRRGYGEDGIYLDHRGDCLDSALHATCTGRWRGVVSLGFDADDYGTRVSRRAFLGSVGPAFAHGCHDLGELGVESVKLLSFGSARDEGVSIAGYAAAPICSMARVAVMSVNGSPDTRTRSARCPAAKRPRSARPNTRAGSAVAAVRARAGLMPHRTRSSSSRCQLLQHGPRVRSIRARQQSDPRISQSPHVVLGPRVWRHLPAMPSRGSRSQRRAQASPSASASRGSPATAAPPGSPRVFSMVAGGRPRFRPRPCVRPGPCPARRSQGRGPPHRHRPTQPPRHRPSSSRERRRPGRGCARQ